MRLRDLGSTNGCEVRGERRQRALLRAGDRFLAGSTLIEVSVEERPAREPPAVAPPLELLAASPSTVRVAAWVAWLADRPVSVLFIGPRGSGRAAWARALHHSSRRADGPFVLHRCGSDPLLGPEGALARAEAGTLVLDEPDRLGPDDRAGLLHHATRGGGPRLISRSIAPPRTLAPVLETRLGALTLELLPLEERIEDLAALADRVLPRFGLATAGPAVLGALRSTPVGFAELAPALAGESEPPSLRRALLEDLIAATKGDVDEAARRLKIDPRTMLDELSDRDVPIPE